MATVAISGSIAQRPGCAGHAWVFLNYMLGFRDLGHDVVLIDRLERDMLDPAATGARGSAIRWLDETMGAVGLEDSYCLMLDGGAETVGLARSEILAQVTGADLLLDFNGFLADEEILAAARRRVFVDIDPGFPQMWEELGLARPFDGYDDFVTVGLGVGRDGSHVPTGGRRWVPTRQPILLDRWPLAPAGTAFTSIGSWRGPFAPIAYRGRTYGLRVHEFRRFAELPGLAGGPFEIALDIDLDDAADLALLRSGSWRLADPAVVAADLSSYRSYVQASMAEISIAKQMYVETGGGWFSDRSVAYLASGKPVLAQDTGFADALPTGEGLLRFSTLEEAVAGVGEIRANLGRHSDAARSIAEELFDSRRVLTDLLEAIGG